MCVQDESCEKVCQIMCSNCNISQTNYMKFSAVRYNFLSLTGTFCFKS